MLTDLYGLPSNVKDVVNLFRQVQLEYGGRNDRNDALVRLFEGEHWVEDGPKAPDGTEYALTFNYVRNVVMRFSSIMKRSPLPTVPYDGSPDDRGYDAAARREKLLLACWDDLMEAWSDAEINASKVSYGVMQAVWSPDRGQPESVNIGLGADVRNRKSYTTNPFKFRSIPPNDFYPIFNTYDTPNDFLAVFRFDGGRLIRAIDLKYGVKLQPTGSFVFQPTSANQPTCDLVEYWDCEKYMLIAMTQVVDASRRQSRPARNRRGLRMRSDVEEDGRQTQYAVLESGENPYGVIPFWLLQNIRTDPNIDPTDGGSMCDAQDIIGLNLHYNDLVSEEAVEVTTNIHRPIVYASDEHQTDPNKVAFRAGAVIPIGIEEKMDTLPWDGEPETISQHLARIEGAIRTLTFLSDAGFGNIPTGLTSTGFRIAIQPLQQIIEHKVPIRERVLRSISMFIIDVFTRKAADDSALRVWLKGHSSRPELVVVSRDDIAGDGVGNMLVDVNFKNLLPRDDNAYMQNEIYMYKSGAQSLETTLANLGFADPQSEIERMKREFSDEILYPERVALTIQARQMSNQGGESGPSGSVQPQRAPEAMAAQQSPMPYGDQMNQPMGPMSVTGDRGIQEMMGMDMNSPMPQYMQMQGAGSEMTAPMTAPQSFSRGPEGGSYGAGNAAPYLGRADVGMSGGEGEMSYLKRIMSNKRGRGNNGTKDTGTK